MTQMNWSLFLVLLHRKIKSFQRAGARFIGPAYGKLDFRRCTLIRFGARQLLGTGSLLLTAFRRKQFVGRIGSVIAYEALLLMAILSHVTVCSCFVVPKIC